MAKPIELVTVSGAAQRMGACTMTLRRAIKKAGIIPDAILIEGSNRLKSPLFCEPRLSQLKALLIQPEIAS